MSGSFAIITFGCRVNQADSLAVEGELVANGLRVAPADSADLVIVNSCSVTASADQGVRQTVRRVARMNPGARVIVTGCYATRRPDEVASLPNVARVVANDDKDHLAAGILAAAGPSTAERYGDGDESCGATSVPGTGGRTALTLRVQTGCEERCSYCIIPQTRGRSRSRPVRDIVAALTRAIAAGYREIVLTGVHLGSYGRDLGDGTTLLSLLEGLDSFDDDVLFRLGSLEPMDCTADVVEMVARSVRIAPHLHLPLQHGSDEMLTAMRRPYSADYYRRLLDDIHARLPHAAVGSDIIVGFPSETAEHFDEMRALLERLPLSHLHVFPYSDRPGTDAASRSDKVPGSLIRERGRAIREIGAAMVRRFRASQSGAVLRALTMDDGTSAVTPNYLKVRLDAAQPRNVWVRVRITADEPLQAEVL